MRQETVDFHCAYIRESIVRGDYTPIACINYLKNHGSDPRTRADWQWIGQQLVMNGWLTVNYQNNFEASQDTLRSFRNSLTRYRKGSKA